MSFSKPKETNASPVKYFLEFKSSNPEVGQEAGAYYYDKEAKVNVRYDLEKFIVLDDSTFGVAGYNEKLKVGLFSNMVRDINDELIVRYFDKDKSVIAQGKYKDIKEVANGSGGNYYKGIYILTGQGDFCNLKVTKSSLGPWIEFTNKKSALLNKYYVEVLEYAPKERVAGRSKIQWDEPVFAFGGTISEDDIKKATKVDSEELQPYLDKYFKGKPVDQSAEHPEEHDDGDSIPMNHEKVVNTDDWASFMVPGKAETLVELSISEIKDYRAVAEETGEFDTFYENVCRAIKEYDTASKTWKTTKTDKGVNLENFSHDDLTGMLAYIKDKKPQHRLRFPLEIAVLETAPESENGVDDCPF